MDGFLLINKPVGITSRACVSYIRDIVVPHTDKRIKVGHAGTLDMLAGGLLIIAVGRTATREIKHIMALDKQYIATAKLGHWTDSLDCNGTLLQESALTYPITVDALEQAIHSFGHQYWQVPPLYSALKHNGKRLSKLTRDKKISEKELVLIARRKQRLIDLHDVQVTAVQLPFFTLKAHVSHGTYIRTLMDDIAQKVHTHATTHALQRIAIGAYSLNKAIALNSVKSIQDVESRIIPVQDML